eukprot:gb/GECH01000813.1/.p1 GENE.gb/GECH01000813.1/~~gb/GECH01000813.1/.p1  ORF type:complete len:197 (+),score=53.03 gb/GECH01000813.1/:1-591(+)
MDNDNNKAKQTPQRNIAESVTEEFERGYKKLPKEFYEQTRISPWILLKRRAFVFSVVGTGLGIIEILRQKLWVIPRQKKEEQETGKKPTPSFFNSLATQFSHDPSKPIPALSQKAVIHTIGGYRRQRSYPELDKFLKKDATAYPTLKVDIARHRVKEDPTLELKSKNGEVEEIINVGNMTSQEIKDLLYKKGVIPK